MDTTSRISALYREYLKEIDTIDAEFNEMLRRRLVSKNGETSAEKTAEANRWYTRRTAEAVARFTEAVLSIER